MTVGSQPSALAAAVNPGLSSEHAAAEQVRNATLMPFLGALGSAAVDGMLTGSVSNVAICALAWVTPPPLALLAGCADAAVLGEVDAAVFAEVDDEELHADATATHTAARIPNHAFRSFIAMSPLRGRKARPGPLIGGLARLTRRSITPPRHGRQEVPYHDYDGNDGYDGCASLRQADTSGNVSRPGLGAEFSEYALPLAPAAWLEHAVGANGMNGRTGRMRKWPAVMRPVLARPGKAEGSSVPLDELVEAAGPAQPVLLDEPGEVIVHQARGLGRLLGDDGLGDVPVLLMDLLADRAGVHARHDVLVPDVADDAPEQFDHPVPGEGLHRTVELVGDRPVGGTLNRLVVLQERLHGGADQGPVAVARRALGADRRHDEQRLEQLLVRGAAEVQVQGGDLGQVTRVDRGDDRPAAWSRLEPDQFLDFQQAQGLAQRCAADPVVREHGSLGRQGVTGAQVPRDDIAHDRRGHGLGRLGRPPGLVGQVRVGLRQAQP